uniref:DUF3048 domain-containing protein n=1 Tax=Agathobacter sp. TaxID=2021311 RepID=UPI0040565966
METKLKKILIGTLLFVCICSLAGCKAEGTKDTQGTAGHVADEADSEMETALTEETETITESEEEIPANQNLLTGIADLSEEAIGKRPVAVMVNNVKAALPQYGIAQADVIFEIPVEADVTRLMALYGDYTKVPKVCSIRSCRKYFPALANGFDAIYVYWGMDDGIRSYVNALDVVQFDGLSNTGGLYGRDAERKSSGYSLEHTGYFDGTGLPAALEKKNARITLEEGKTDTAFQFYAPDEQVKPQGSACKKVEVDFGAALATLEYKEETNTYFKSLNGKPQVDGKTGTQLEFTNVFVLETDITIDDNGVHKKINLQGGNGYYISNGAVVKITWSKGDEEAGLKFFDENGEELSVNRGKSYIAVNYKNQVVFE